MAAAVPVAVAPVGAVPDGRRHVLPILGAARLAAAVERAARGYFEQVLALVWEDWICAEASRGQLERWRDTHRL